MNIALAHPTKVPTRTLWVCLLVVALCTAAFPFIHSYGTALFLAVGLNGWFLVAKATSQVFADQHRWVVLLVAAALNVVLYSIVALPGYFAVRRRAPIVASFFYWYGLRSTWRAYWYFSLPLTDRRHGMLSNYSFQRTPVHRLRSYKRCSAGAAKFKR